MESNPKIKLSDFSSGSLTYEPKINPVFALDVERHGYWCLSGLSSGGISLYTLRYSEGIIQHYFKHSQKSEKVVSNVGHNDTVSSIKLNMQQDKFISGSWDKTIKQWDLNTGKCTQTFVGSSGQVSGIQYRPLGLADFVVSYNDSDDNQAPSTDNRKIEAQDNSDMESLFGDSDEEKNNKLDAERKANEAQDKAKSFSVNTSKATNKTYSNDAVFMSSSIDGTINIWDIRCSESNGPVLRLGVSDSTPPWCMSAKWSNCGEFIYAGRRNSCVEEMSLKMPFKRSLSGYAKSASVPNILRTLQFPKISGPVSAVSTMPNSDFILCGSIDNIRLYDLKLHRDPGLPITSSQKKATTPFTIIPGHHGGILSCLCVDDTGRFLMSASGNRGWGHSAITDTVLIYEIDFQN